ncbi:MAG TPA: hypothetical protein VKQ07_01250 [Jatrophihabitantaceae bacterium]|nr:hypothetical protein [Jatrophihabitantaceae bacterium]
MNRKTLDRLLAAGGAALAALLIVGGALLTWAHTYVHNEVHSQLSAQKIFFPPKGSQALASPEIGPYLNKYAGQQLTTGPQAKAYANHFIRVHLNEMTGGQTYSQLSTKAQADPTNTKLATEVATVFRGETLRGLLLNAYAFDTLGYIAFIGSIVAYLGAVVMGVLAGLGFWHARKAAAIQVPSFPAQEMINN